MNSDLAYKPPYTLSETSVSLIADIAAALERSKIVMEGPDGAQMRARRQDGTWILAECFATLCVR